MRKGTAMVVTGSILLVPSVLALSLTALISTAVGRKLMSRGWAFLGLNEFLIYWDPLFLLVLAVLGATLVLVGRRIQRTRTQSGSS